MNGRSPKTVVVLTAVVAAAATAVLVLHGDDTNHGAQAVLGSGVIASQTRAVGSFSKVELAGAADVKITVGRPPSLALRGDDNLLGLVDTDVDGRTLVVSQHGTFTTDHVLEVSISAPTLTAVSVTGAGGVAVRGLHATTFTADLSGAGRFDIDGSATEVRVSVTGAGEAALEHLLAREVTALISGTGSAHVCARRSLDATVSGIGEVVYRGDPALLTTHVSGTGAVVPE